MAIRIRKGSGNVFKDAGFPTPEATHLQIRSDLMPMRSLKCSIASRLP